MLSVEMACGDVRLWANRAGEDWFVKRSPQGVTYDEWHESDKDFADNVVRFFKAGCDRFVVYLEDTILVLPKHDATLYNSELIAFDVVTGTHYRATVTDLELIAILALGIGGDEVDGSDGYYSTLESVLASWPNECRPVP